MTAEIRSFLLSADASVREAMALIDRNSEGIALIVDPEQRLIGTVTDGDLRRAMLASIPLDATIGLMLERRPPSVRRVPQTAPVGTPGAELLELFSQHKIRHIPLLDATDRVTGIALLSGLSIAQQTAMSAVVMAGGFGKRLHPLTETTPKPMLPIGDKPLMEHIIGGLRHAGIRQVSISTHYLSEAITSHFKDGKEFGVNVSYVTEDKPLGTAGALGLMEQPGEPLLVINGDILTKIDYRAMLRFHVDHKSTLTVGLRPYEIEVPYGVVDCDGTFITGVTEKPLIRHFVNAGIYMLDPSAFQYIRAGERLDMPDLIKRILDDGHPVAGFPIREYWLDVGRPGDYEQAQRDHAEGIWR